MRLRRARVRGPAALVTLLAGLLLAAAALVLGPDAPPPRPTVAGGAPPSSAAPGPGPLGPEPPRPGPQRSGPARPAAPAGLSPLGLRWREAVVALRRRELLDLTRALRAAPGGRDDLVRLAGDGEARVRAYALRELGRRREADLAPVFSAALTDPSPPARENARWALAELGR